MDNNNKNQNRDSKSIEQTAANPDQSQTKFNAGGNDSDYDGGHPKSGTSKSGERTDLKEELQEQKDLDGKPYNSGGNDSDYDGGHPT